MSYTRKQFAAAVDEAHEALHDAHERFRANDGLAAQDLLLKAHDALHHVGAGLPRVDCGTQDPAAQKLLAELTEARKRELPCGHTLADLISGMEPNGRLSITTCGACLSDRQPEIRLWNRFRRAWRASGLSLGKLLLHAMKARDEFAFGPAAFLHCTEDEAMVEMCERYVREHSAEVTRG